MDILIIGTLSIGLWGTLFLGQIMPELMLVKYGPLGFSFLLLIYLYKVIQDHRRDIKQMFEDQRNILIDTINKNTNALAVLSDLRNSTTELRAELKELRGVLKQCNSHRP